MLDSIRLYFSNLFDHLNAWFSSKSAHANDWIVSTRFSWRWSFLKQCVLGFVGVSSKLWSSKSTPHSHFCDRASNRVPLKLVSIAAIPAVLNKAHVHNADKLIELLEKRPKGKPLITVSNHDSCCDDPLVFGKCLALTATQAHYATLICHWS